MATRWAGHTQKCGACAEAFRLQPERIVVRNHSSGFTFAIRCPFCGFLNRPSALAATMHATLTMVRPAELMPKGVVVEKQVAAVA